MKRILFIQALALISALSFFSCSDDDSNESSQAGNESQESSYYYLKNKYKLNVVKDEVPAFNPDLYKADNITEEGKEVVDAINGFSFKLFKKGFATRGNKENTFLSPYSVQQVLSPLSNGASGQTFQELMDAMEYEGSLDDYNAGNRTVTNLLEKSLKDCRFEVGNALWVDLGMQVYQSYVSTIRNFYDSEVFALDFGADDAGKHINSWCADKTHDLITKLVDDAPLPWTMMLANAVYFKAGWRAPFDEALTRKDKFTNTDGTKTDVDMMSRNESQGLSYAALEDMEVLKIPFTDSFSMMVCLPHEGVSLAGCVNGMDKEAWSHITASLKETMVKAYLPKFSITQDTGLNEILQSMGIKKVFEIGADLSRIGPSCGPLSGLMQSAVINVDEKGTEAAAVTIGTVSANIDPVEEKEFVEFKVNRPFMFAIFDHSTGAILFLGAVNEL